MSERPFPSQLADFDAALTRALAERFPIEPLAVPHPGLGSDSKGSSYLIAAPTDSRVDWMVGSLPKLAAART